MSHIHLIIIIHLIRTCSLLCRLASIHADYGQLLDNVIEVVFCVLAASLLVLARFERGEIKYICEFGFFPVLLVLSYVFWSSVT